MNIKYAYKLLIGLLAVNMFGNKNMVAQCIPDANLTIFGVYPKRLPDATLNVNYSAVLSLLERKDTLLTVQPLGSVLIPFDSVQLVNISNLPAGLTYICNQPRCTQVSGLTDFLFCAKISGTPTNKPANDSLTVTYKIHITILGTPSSLNMTQKIRLAFSGTSSLNLSKQQSLSISPNPINEDFTILGGTEFKNAELIIRNSLGQSVLTFQQVSGPAFTANLASISAGNYTVECRNQGIISYYRISKL